MHILAILRPNASASLDKFRPLMLQEEQAVWKHYAAGTLRSMNFQPEPLRVLLQFEAADKASVQTLLTSFPMVAADLFDVDLIESGPWLPMTALFSSDAVPFGLRLTLQTNANKGGSANLQWKAEPTSDCG